VSGFIDVSHGYAVPADCNCGTTELLRILGNTFGDLLKSEPFDVKRHRVVTGRYYFASSVGEIYGDLISH